MSLVKNACVDGFYGSLFHSPSFNASQSKIVDLENPFLNISRDLVATANNFTNPFKMFY